MAQRRQHSVRVDRDRSILMDDHADAATSSRTLMSTRQLIFLALVCGLVILLAGAFQLALILW